MSGSPERAARLRAALRLYVLTDRELSQGRADDEVARAAIAGGATAVQLRWKTGPLREAIHVGRRVRAIGRAAGVLFVVNDRVDLALALGSDGVHLGEEDFPVAEARELLGPDVVIGYSPATLDSARRAIADGADYLGVGPVYATATKSDAGPVIGVEGVAAFVAGVDVPIVGIGGINAENAAAVIEAGAAGVAVISAVVAADDVAEAARRLRAAIDRALEGRG